MNVLISGEAGLAGVLGARPQLRPIGRTAQFVTEEALRNAFRFCADVTVHEVSEPSQADDLARDAQAGSRAGHLLPMIFDSELPDALIESAAHSLETLLSDPRLSTAISSAHFSEEATLMLALDKPAISLEPFDLLRSFLVSRNYHYFRAMELKATEYGPLPAGVSRGVFIAAETSRAYGFVVPDGRTDRVFVHGLHLERGGLGTLRTGQVVFFHAIDRGDGSVVSSIAATPDRVKIPQEPDALVELRRRARAAASGDMAKDRPAPAEPRARIVERGHGQALTGTVKWFNVTKGYGFIEPADGGADIFVHISAVERSGLGWLEVGQKVSYQIDGEEHASDIAPLSVPDQ